MFPKLRNHDIQQLSSDPPVCSTCESGNIIRESVCFCKECDEYLCNACKSGHKKLPGHIIVDIKNHGQKNDKIKHTNYSLTENKLRTSESETIGLQTPPADRRRNDVEFQVTAPPTESHSSAKNEDSSMTTKLREHNISDVVESEQRDNKSKHTGPSIADSRMQTSGPEAKRLQTPPADGSLNDRELKAPAPATESQSSAEGEDFPMSKSPDEPFSILKMSLKALNIVKIVSDDDDNMRIQDCVFMPSGDLLLVDMWKKEVLHLDSSFTIRERLKQLSTIQIAVLSENIAVVIDGRNVLQFLEVMPKLRIIKSVPLERWSSLHRLGMAAGGGLIYVYCFRHQKQTDDDKGHIKVLDSNGKEIRRIDAVQNGQVLFAKPYHLTASTTRLYISGESLTCLKLDGTLVYQYKDINLGWIRGIVVDSEDNVLVFGDGSRQKAKDKFHVIKANGKRHISKALEQSIEIPGYNCSDCLSFRPSDRTLAMGALSDLYIFKTAIDL